ncbi:MAG: DMT family transporter [Candidatus Korobacteraceae bacterium]|jgi:drug/metabolite transporter (DMT)-like permease
MNSGIFTGAALSLGAAAIWGGGDFAGGIATRRANVFRVVAGAHACGLVLMLALAWMTGEPIPPYSSLGWGVVAGITGAFGIAALYKGLAIGRMGVVAPVASVVTAVLPVLFGFRTEGLPGRLQLAGFALALVSIWLVARPEGEIDSHRGLGLAILAGVMFGLFLVSGKQAGQYGVFWPLVAARAASTLLMLLIVAFLPRDPRSLRSALLPILLSGLCDSGANAMFIAATRHGRLDVAAVLSSLYPASTVILARVLLKERISRMQGVGIVGALAAVALISTR